MKLHIFCLLLTLIFPSLVIAAEDTTPGDQLRADVQKGNLVAVQAALDKGMSANDQSIYGMTPTMIAAQEGHLDILKLLISKGADVNAYHHLGQCTALGFAAEEFRPEVVSVLLKAGAKLLLSEKITKNPMVKAVSRLPKDAVERERQLQVLQMLLDAGGDVNSVDHKGRTPLVMAAGANNAEIVELLLKNKSDPDIKDQVGNTALHVAAHKGHHSVIRILLLQGKADPHIMNNMGRTPLQVAVQREQIGAVKMILNNVPNSPAKEADAKVALMLAAESGHSPSISALLVSGLSVNTKDENGNTPLMLASKNGHIQVVVALLREGADVNELNNRKETARMLAMVNEHEVIEQLLQEAGGRCF
jgi:ankyrin repeat protein